MADDLVAPAAVACCDPARPTTRTLGVLGGMGPLATAYFYEQVVRATPASSDQAHIPAVVWSDGRVPDRSAAIERRGPSPVTMLARGVSTLVGAGADIIAMPCNTAHAFLTPLRELSTVPFLDMIHETVTAAQDQFPGLERVGILGTAGTRRALLYEHAASIAGITIVQVSWDQQAALTEEAIRIVKGGGRLDLAERLLAQAARSLVDSGAEVCVAACTELPLVAGQAAEVMPVIDSVACLARAAVRHCLPQDARSA